MRAHTYAPACAYITLSVLRVRIHKCIPTLTNNLRAHMCVRMHMSVVRAHVYVRAHIYVRAHLFEGSVCAYIHTSIAE